MLVFFNAHRCFSWHADCPGYSMVKENMMVRSITGTIMMTAFSYLLSAASGKNYREPRLLATMLRRLGIKPSYLAGWFGHFAVGAAWAPVLQWMNASMHTGRINKSLVLGLSSGIIAVCVWRGLFALHPHPPKNDRAAFYRQLVLAHWIFSLPFLTGRSPNPSPSQIPAAGKP